MDENIREQGISLKSLIKLTFKNLFSIGYFTIVGLIIALVYTQFIVKPNYEASGNIENIGAVSTALMQTIPTIVGEEQTLTDVVEKMEVSEVDSEAKVSEIRKSLSAASYNTTTLKIKVTYSGSNKEEVEIVINLVIETAIERFVERNASAVGKIQKQANAIKAIETGLSKKIIYLFALVMGAGFGAIIGVGRDLLNRKFVSEADIEEYLLPFHFINLKRESKDEVVLTSDKIKGSVPDVLENLEELAKDNKVKIVGFANLGNKELDALINNFADNRNAANFKTLIIDLNIEEPFIQGLLDVNTEVNVTSVLTYEKVLPIKVKDNLYVLPAIKYDYPARFLKEDKLSNAIKGYREEYDYVFINLPAKDFYPAILFSFDLIDSLVINLSFNETKMKDLDKYISGISKEHRSKIYLNAIDSTIKKDYLAFLKKKTKDA